MQTEVLMSTFLLPMLVWFDGRFFAYDTLISIFQEAERGMKRIMLVPSYTVLLVLCLGGLPAQAATIYVRPQGNDATPCVQAQNAQTPRRTINTGITCLSGGDTLIVGGGTYDECLNDYGPTPIPAGTSWATATIIKSAPGEAVWLKVTAGCPGGGGLIEVDKGSSQYVIFDGLNIDANSISSYGIGVSSNYIRFQNLEVKHARTGLKIDGQYNEIINLDVHHAGFNAAGIDVCPSPVGCHGMYISGWYNLIEHTRIHDNNCIGVTFSMEGGTVLYNTVRYSEIYNNPCYGVMAFPYNYVYNNIIRNNGTGVKFGSFAKVHHNVVYKNGEIGLWPSGSGQEMKNNIVLGHRWDILNQDTGTVDFASNICTAVGIPDTIGCTMAASPTTIFQDISVQDFHLRAGSPAIGTGVPLSSLGLTVDKDSVSRPPTGPVDVGAYQYTPQGPVLSAP
jgi:hypothetical protein